MVADTKIEWADDTVNFWWGCTQIAPPCDFCYAKDIAARFAPSLAWNGPPQDRVARAVQELHALNRRANKEGRKRFVFINSMSDTFDKLAEDSWRAAIFETAARCPNLILLVLTKRIGRVLKWAEDKMVFGRWPWNMWLGITTGNQKELDRDAPVLLQTKAALGIPRVFFSVEPMLGHVDAARYLWRDACTACAQWPRTDCLKCGGREHTERIDWVICGGESGKHARPMHPDWARSLRDQCAAGGVPFFFKQWGEFGPCELHPAGTAPIGIVSLKGEYRPPEQALTGKDSEGWEMICRFGKGAAGRLLDGVEHNGRPQP